MKPSPRKRLHPVQIIAHVTAFLLFGWALLPFALTRDPITQVLFVNPIQTAMQRTGDSALILLIASLACTPLYRVTRFGVLLKLRRPVGLYAFAFAATHLSLFVGVDYGFAWRLIWLDVQDKPFVWVGLAALAILTAMAVTSFKWWMIRMGKRWKVLHRLVYAASILVVIHFAWALKGDITSLQGDVVRPILAGLVVAVLLIMRIPFIQKRLPRFGGRSSSVKGSDGKTRRISVQKPTV